MVWLVACGPLAAHGLVPDALSVMRKLGIVSDEELTTAGTPTP